MYIGHTGLLAMDDTLITTLNILMCMIWEYFNVYGMGIYNVYV